MGDMSDMGDNVIFMLKRAVMFFPDVSGKIHVVACWAGILMRTRGFNGRHPTSCREFARLRKFTSSILRQSKTGSEMRAAQVCGELVPSNTITSFLLLLVVGMAST